MSMDNKPRSDSGISRWFREMRSELKKVVWPTPRQVVKNTGIVLLMVFLIGIIIWVADWILNTGLAEVLKLRITG